MAEAAKAASPQRDYLGWQPRCLRGGSLLRFRRLARNVAGRLCLALRELTTERSQIAAPSGSATMWWFWTKP